MTEDDSVLGIPKRSWKKEQVQYRNSFKEKLNTSALMEKGPLNSVATKDKGKAAITAIKYSAPDRVMLFSFYKHS